ncbi:MAG: sulfatase [Proteobacteria bacterium]|nr:sulfatase [Pseudomonadota bacterium]
MDTPVQRWGRGALLSVGLGFVAGGLETAALASTVKLPLTMVDFLILGNVTVLLMGTFAFAIGILAGFVQVGVSTWLPTRAVALQLAVTGGLLCAYYLVQGAASLYVEGRTIAAAAMSAMSIGFGGVIYYNARYWLAREAAGKKTRLSWLSTSYIFSLAIIILVSVAFQFRDTGGAWALEDDKNVVLISIDTLRRDHVGAFGGHVKTPNMDRIAAEGVAFLDTVTPMPETAPAHATMLTGLHPLRHKVLSNGHKLSRGYRTLAEVLEVEGYATGAFVSSVAVGANGGLEQGFLVFDDDFTPFVPAATRINLVGWLARAWMLWGKPAMTPWLFERSGVATNKRFAKWLDRHADVPFFAWIHYFEPHTPYVDREGDGIDMRLRMTGDFTDEERQILRRQYADEVQAADQFVGEVAEALDQYGLSEETLLIIVSDHGELLGEHGVDFDHRGLYDETVRVPLIMRMPGVELSRSRVEPQVRLMDLFPTILQYLGIDESESEGVELIGFVTGDREATMWCSLVGRQERRLQESALIGMRNNGVKYIREMNGSKEWLFDLETDPEEASHLESRSETLKQARRLVGPEATALERLLSQPTVVGSTERAMLEALGYTQ